MSWQTIHALLFLAVCLHVLMPVHHFSSHIPFVHGGLFMFAGNPYLSAGRDVCSRLREGASAPVLFNDIFLLPFTFFFLVGTCLTSFLNSISACIVLFCFQCILCSDLLLLALTHSFLVGGSPLQFVTLCVCTIFTLITGAIP